MSIQSLCKYAVVTVGPQEDLSAAARLMREKHVGYLVVVEPSRHGGSTPVGVITDRDIVVSVVVQEVNPRTLTVADVMSREPLVLDQDLSVDAALARLRKRGVRRAPVVAANGGLVGVLSIDDVLGHVASQLDSIAGSIRKEQHIERRTRP